MHGEDKLLHISGKVLGEGQVGLEDVQVGLNKTSKITFTNKKGQFELLHIKPGMYQLVCQKLGYKTATLEINLVSSMEDVQIVLEPLEYTSDEVTVEGGRNALTDMSHLRAVEGVSIYESKKTEVIQLRDVVANTATNEARQVFAKVPGIVVWESDDAGLQLGIGARGLSPNRSANFNIRQNGYEISADAIGYPESYYTPPVEALDRVEMVRGAASLQYGPQFGGLVNFIMKNGPENKKFELNSRQSVGSFGLFNSFNSIGGTVKKLRYYGYVQYKRADGWRSNSDFEIAHTFARVSRNWGEKWELGLEYTHLSNQSKQPGGLTDRQFESDMYQSNRSRNWFNVGWNIAAAYATYTPSSRSKLNIRAFSNHSFRRSLGNLERINLKENPKTPRTLISDQFSNLGIEARWLRSYHIAGNISSLVVGTRAYQGYTRSSQTDGAQGEAPDYNIAQNDTSTVFRYLLTGRNVAWFAENIFNITPKWSVTPGLRWEYLSTHANGYYTERPTDGAGNIIALRINQENRAYTRQFPLLGIGSSYRLHEHTEFYGNYSQNYRPVTFSDIRVRNPNFRIDPDIQDESGYNADLGLRGSWTKYLQYDASFFYLFYRNRIGNTLLTDPNTFIEYRYQTNNGESVTMGLEAFAELNLLEIVLQQPGKWRQSLFTNFTLNNARYTASPQKEIIGNKVEYVPAYSLRMGTQVGYGRWAASLLFSYIDQQYTDATNATLSSEATIGIIPAYHVVDLSLKYKYNWLQVEGGVNNLTNQQYFTRRAVSYPGPGIMPAKPINIYLTVGFVF